MSTSLNARFLKIVKHKFYSAYFYCIIKIEMLQKLNMYLTD